MTGVWYFMVGVEHFVQILPRQKGYTNSRDLIVWEE